MDKIAIFSSQIIKHHSDRLTYQETYHYYLSLVRRINFSNKMGTPKQTMIAVFRVCL